MLSPSWRALIAIAAGALVLIFLAGQKGPIQVDNSLVSQSSPKLDDEIKTIFANHGISAMNSNKKLVDDIAAAVARQSSSARNFDVPNTKTLQEQQFSPLRHEAQEEIILQKVAESRTEATLVTRKPNSEGESSEVKSAKSYLKSQPFLHDQKTSNALQERQTSSLRPRAFGTSQAAKAAENEAKATQVTREQKNQDSKTLKSPSGIFYKPIGCGQDDLIRIQKLLTRTGDVRFTRVVPISVGGHNMHFHVYGSGDVVSSSIAGHRSWEPGEMNQVMSHLHGGSKVGKKPLLLDIGANIGWFSMSAAMRGFDVIGFEPFAKNVYLQRSTMCDKNNGPLIKKHLNLYMMGLDSKSRRCETWQNPSVNFGDTVTICDDTRADRKALWRAKGFVKLSDCPTATLDDALAAGIFPRRITVLKMDIEGYEPKVLAGARNFFKSAVAPDVIIMEAVIDRLEDALGNGRSQLIKEFKLLLRYGYVTGNMDSPDKIDRSFLSSQGNPLFRRKGSRSRRLSKGALPSEYVVKDDDVNDHLATEGTAMRFSFQRRNTNGHHGARTQP